MLRNSLAVFSLAAVVGAQVSLDLVGTVDLAVTSGSTNPEYIGSNPSAVAWNGTDLWVAGYNNASGTSDTAIIKISDALTAPVFGAPFGVVAATPNGRGYTGLAIANGMLAAAHDFGASSADGVTQWDAATSLNNWSKTARGSSGIAFDPGFGPSNAGRGTGWTTFGSGRRALQDNTSGSDLYTLANGMIINTVLASTNWRDIDFDPTTGDVYLRSDNKVVKCTRTGANSLTGNAIIAGGAVFSANNQNLEFVNHDSGKVLFWNDRASGAGAQAFASVIKCTRVDGTSVAVHLDYGVGAPPAAGAAAYDFSYDAASSTLAISDFSNRKAYVFAVSLYVPYGAYCQGQGGIAPTLSASGDSRDNGAITYLATGTAPSSIGAFVFGYDPASVVLGLPPGCLQQVTPILFSSGLFFTAGGAPGSGSGSFTLNLGVGLAGFPLKAQAVVLEAMAVSSVITTNGIATVLQ